MNEILRPIQDLKGHVSFFADERGDSCRTAGRFNVPKGDHVTHGSQLLRFHIISAIASQEVGIIYNIVLSVYYELASKCPSYG